MVLALLCGLSIRPNPAHVTLTSFMRVTEIDYTLTDIVAGRYDAGVRFGEQVAKDMISVPIEPEVRFVVVGAPDYLAQLPAPTTPQELLVHRCINLRLPTHGGLYAWEFEKDACELRVRVEGQLVFNSISPVVEAALAGFVLAYVAEDLARPHLAAGQLSQVLGDWSPPFPGYHLLSQPPTALAGLRLAGGRAALQR